MSSKNIKVSIIIPVYNGSNYVNLAIDSALRQTYKNIEIIVINDGSKDNTLEIINSYKDKIKVSDKDNGGVSTALNLGIKNMTGDYFSWLSHDDLYYPEKIEREVNYLIENNLVGTKTILYSNFDYNDKWGNHIYTCKYNTVELNRESALPLQKAAISGLTLLIPKEAFKDAGDFDTGLRACQDYKLWFEMYKKGYKFIHLEDVLTVTRIHDLSVSNTSPRVMSEGNDFWVNYVKYFNDTYKKKYYGSVYNYYYDFLMLFSEGPYEEAKELCRSNLKIIEDKININDYNVSVILPFTKISDSLFESIDSVLKQTFKNIELLLINNGCVEENKKLDKIIKNNNNIKYITYKNKKNNGALYKDIIKKCSGNYVCFIKDNSVFDNKKIEYQLLKMLASEDKVSQTSYYNQDKEFIDTGIRNGMIYPEWIKEYKMNISTFMYEKNYLEESINKINDNLCDIDDNYLYLYIINKEDRVLGIRECLTTTKDIYENGNKIKYLISIICSLFDINEVSSQVDDLLEIYSYNKGVSVHSLHMEELNRYRTMLSKEFRLIYRSSKKSKLYLLDNDKIINFKFSKFFRIIRKLLKK